jgi:hypothetical protein
VLLTKYYWNDQIRGGEMEGGSTTHVKDEKSIQSFGGENLKRRDHFEDTGLEGG